MYNLRQHGFKRMSGDKAVEIYKEWPVLKKPRAPILVKKYIYNINFQ
jgi:hypothetical protein